MSAATALVGRGRLSVRRSQAFGVVELLLAALAVLFAARSGDADATFVLNLARTTAARVPDLVLPVAPTAYAVAAVAAALGGVQLSRGFGRRAYTVLAVVVGIWIVAFLAWAARDGSLNVVGMLQSTLLRSTPLALGALAGLISERAGVINIAIEGQFLTAAFAGAVAGSAAGGLVGVGAGVAAGGLVGALLAVLTIRYRADQIIVGVVIDVLALGLTGFLTDRILRGSPELNSPDIFRPLEIPLLSEVPVVGPVLFDASPFIYAMFGLVAALHWLLFHTRWGLRVRAVGEHPRAADTVGIAVHATRYRNTILGGMVAGLGGAFFTLGSVGSFGENMTAGRGFIALAAMIVGRWAPVGALSAALVFGFADALQSSLAILRTPIPSEVLLMAPYLATIFVVAGVVGRVRPPAADGQPYEQE